MSSTSDSDIVTTKRPKTKRQIVRSVDNISPEPNDNDEDGEERSPNSANKSVLSHDQTSVTKKAAKRIRESEEESSISSDEETMSKKRIKKNSDEENESYRPKKRVSAAARRRREAAKSVREKQMAELDTDSEYDSDQHRLDSVENGSNSGKDTRENSGSKLRDHGSASKRKERLVSDSENDGTDDPEHLQKEEKSGSKKEKDQLGKSDCNVVKKDENSSSAYNSDSEGVQQRHTTFKKLGKDLTSENEESSHSDGENATVRSPKRNSSFLKAHRRRTASSESDLDDDKKLMKVGSLQNNNFHRTKETKVRGSDEELAHDVCESKSFCDDGPTVKSADSESDKSVSNSSSEQPQSHLNLKNKDCWKLKVSEKGSSLKEVPSPGKENSKLIREKKKKFDALTSSSSEAESSHATKDTGQKKTHSKHNSLSSGEDSCSDSIPLQKAKPASTKNEDSESRNKALKQTLKCQNTHVSNTESSSDEDRPLKKTKSSIVKEESCGEKKKVRQSLKSQKTHASHNENSSDEERPPKKTKPVLSKKGVDSQRKEKSKEPVSSESSHSLNEVSSDDDRPLKGSNSKTTVKGNSCFLEDDSNPESDAKGKDEVQSNSESSSDSGEIERETKHLERKNTNKSKEKKGLKEVGKHLLQTKKPVIKNDAKDSGSMKKHTPSKQKAQNKSERLEEKSSKNLQVSADESGTSSDSDVPLKKKADKGGNKIGKNFPDTNTEAKKEAKVVKTDESESESSSEETEVRKMLKKLEQKKEIHIKKEMSDSDCTLEEKKSDSEPSDSSDEGKRIGQVTKLQSKNSPEIKVKQDFSDSAESDDSEEDKSNKITKGKSSHNLNKSNKTAKIKVEKSASSGNDSDSSSGSDTKNKRKKKAPGKMEIRINNLKKYLRAAGIRVKSYDSVWEGCKSDKQRADKLTNLLEEHGMKGRPSLQKCKKLRQKIERKREVEELDLNNIINEEEGGKTTRYNSRSSRRGGAEKKPSEAWEQKKAAEKTAEIKQRFSRIKDLIESDSGSD